ncbi:MAG TPA: ribose-5-phosphate isomerase RpiA [Candidatus Aphodousia faecigallinarum]|uniref:Ribose-5-phosphate isomerase A n=1 Tax=Candidatus Aphodousia faecigallinarum TaxID=2840677 RepID=A0A9D1LDV9_9BURK|nr:ribose-5-phosphate isomerase RpiA [Candidatus Aphodousia faecigallinarum]
MNQQELKKLVGQAALKYVKEGEILGVGTGSTVDCFIDALKVSGMKIPACVSSSERSTQKLLSYGFKVLDLNEVERIGVYVDGADEIDSNFAMIKGGGGALTREKIVAMVSDRFVCIADASKKVDVLGKFPLPIEVIPMAVRAVSREIEKLGGKPVLRDFTTDNGNKILDVHGWSIENPIQWEEHLNQIVGVVTVGLFAKRGADVLLLGTENGVKTFSA